MKNLFLFPFVFGLYSTALSAQTFLPDIDCPSLGGSVTGNIITVTLANLPSSNNSAENFEAFDPRIHAADSTWNFEGYIVYQLDTCAVPLPFENFMFDSLHARPVAQCDLVNGISLLINHDTANSCAAVTMVNGADAGLQHTFTFTTDAFTGQPMQTGHTYSYTAIAYATNAYFSDSTCAPLTSTFLIGHHQHLFCAQTTGTAGIHENETNAALHLFPSPVSENISVDLRNFSGAVHLAVYDVTGQCVQQHSLPGGEIPELSVSTLIPGVYLLQAVSDGKVSFSRFVKE